MTQQPEPPEGWERRKKFLFRQYGERFATIVRDSDQDWFICVFDEHGDNLDWHGSLDAAVAWANDQLGVPKPVELVEREFADGSVLVCDANQSRSARVRPARDEWSVDDTHWTSWPTKKRALEAARQYVRGVQ